MTEVQARDLAQLAKVIKGMADGRDLRLRLRRELRQTATPVLASLKRAYAGLPSEGESARRGRPSLRRTLVRASKIRTSFSAKAAGVVLKVDPKAMPEGMRGLPPYIEGDAPWRHPVPKDQTRYVRQAAMPAFWAAVRPFEHTGPEAADRVLQEIKQEIENG